jgi:peroxiredoxin
VPTAMGMAKRQSFIIKDGKIVWTSLQAKTAEHAQEVKAALASIR